MCLVLVGFVELVSNPTQSDQLAIVRSFKKLRDFYNVKEKKVCQRCPKNKICPIAFRIPNLQYDAGAMDVFNVILAYEELALRMDESADKVNLDEMMETNSEVTDTERDALERLKMYNLKYRSAVITLNSLEKMTSEYLDDENLTLRKFENAVKAYEFEGRIVKSKEQPSRDKELVKPKTEVAPSSKETKLQAYRKRFDDPGSLKPQVAPDNKKKPTQKIPSKDIYMDIVKKKTSTAIETHFFKTAKKNLNKPTPEEEPKSKKFSKSADKPEKTSRPTSRQATKPSQPTLEQRQSKFRSDPQPAQTSTLPDPFKDLIPSDPAKPLRSAAGRRGVSRQSFSERQQAKTEETIPAENAQKRVERRKKEAAVVVEDEFDEEEFDVDNEVEEVEFSYNRKKKQVKEQRKGGAKRQARDASYQSKSRDYDEEPEARPKRSQSEGSSMQKLVQKRIGYKQKLEIDSLRSEWGVEGEKTQDKSFKWRESQGSAKGKSGPRAKNETKTESSPARGKSKSQKTNTKSEYKQDDKPRPPKGQKKSFSREKSTGSANYSKKSSSKGDFKSNKKFTKRK